MIGPIVLAVVMAAMQHGHHAAPQKGMRAPTVAFDSAGKAWRTWIDGGHVWVSVSSDRGQTWRRPTRVTRVPETIDANGESRPKIAHGSKGEVYVSWTKSGRKPYTGDILFSRSVDDGLTFEAPRTINDDGVETGHRFDALAVGKDGAVHLAWVDKRDLDRAKAASKKYEGAALYYTVSRDGGRTFAANRKIKDNVCECCRIAPEFDTNGELLLLWRDATENIRDHSIVRIGKNGDKPAKATTDGWKIDGCPHHGPDLAVAADGVRHMVWFTGTGPHGMGTFYGRLSANGRPLGTPRRLTETVAGHAVVVAHGRKITVAWKEASAGSEGSSVMVTRSADGGATFDAPRAVAQTAGMSDHPFLVESSSGLYLSWFAAAEGHRLIPIKDPIAQ